MRFDLYARPMGWILALVALLTIACSGDKSSSKTPAAPTPVPMPTITTQRWNFVSGGGTATGLMQNGASTSPDDMCCWQSNFGGCTVNTQFAVQFSGSSVRLLSFRIARTAGTCSGVSIAQSGGTGTANGSFGSATTATGTSTLIFSTPLGQAGGTANWTASRQ